MATDALRIVFAGTPIFAARHLDALISGGLNVVSVYSQPDRPAGRGKQLKPSPVKETALAHQLPVFQPASLNTPEALSSLIDAKPDVMVVVAYGLLLPPLVLQLPRLGCINVHASLLPRWRGAAPIERALMAGDLKTGVTIMQMDAGLDTGPMLLRAETVITDADNSATLTVRLAELGCSALVSALTRLPALLQSAQQQQDALATHARKIDKQEALIDWSRDAKDIHNCVRALYPRSPAYTFAAGKRIRLLASEVVDTTSHNTPGKVLRCADNFLDIACGAGVLRVSSLQLDGKNPVSVASLVNGYPELLVPDRLLGKSAA